MQLRRILLEAARQIAKVARRLPAVAQQLLELRQALMREARYSRFVVRHETAPSASEVFARLSDTAGCSPRRTRCRARCAPRFRATRRRRPAPPGWCAARRHQFLHVAHGVGQTLAGEPRILERGLERTHVLVAEDLIEAVRQLHQVRGQCRQVAQQHVEIRGRGANDRIVDALRQDPRRRWPCGPASNR